MSSGESSGVADVTVVIPARNRATVLPRALASVATQLLRPTSVVVVDDGSDDETAAVARAGGAVVLSHRCSQGAGEARNTGIKWAHTRWVAFLDSDDEWAPDHLETVMAAASGYSLVTSVLVDTDGRARGNTSGEAREIHPEMLFFPENVVCTSTVLAERSALVDAGLFNSMDRAEDLELWVRMLGKGRGLAVSRPTAIYHTHGAYVDATLQARNRAGTREVLQAYMQASWMSKRLLSRIEGQIAWDDFRHALHRREAGAAVRGLCRLLSHPSLSIGIMRTIRHRRRGRAPHWIDDLDLSAEQWSRFPRTSVGRGPMELPAQTQ